MEALQQWDEKWLLFFNLHLLGKDTNFWALVTNTLFWIPLFVAVIYFIFSCFGRPKGKYILFYLTGSVLLNVFLMHTIKFLVKRPRPFYEDHLLTQLQLVSLPDNYSFYSGHASFSFLLATFTVFLFKKYNRWTYLVFIFPLLFATSRLVVGVHYPSDILVGALIGSCIAVGVYYTRVRQLVTE